jgi:hypothetical protein
MHYPLWMYIAAAVLILVLIVLYCAHRKGVRKDIATIRDDVTRQIMEGLIDELPEVIDEDQQHKIATLRAQLASLREQRNEGEWTRIGVRLHGFKGPGYYVDSKIYATVEMNLVTGTLRAAPAEYRGSVSSDNAWWNHLNPGVPRTELGAPVYQRIQDDPYAVILLGERYYFA